MVHGANLEAKERATKEYSDPLSQQYLQAIRATYNHWHSANMELQGPFSQLSETDADLIGHRVALFENYKNFLDQKVYAEHFDSRSNLHSSVLEEFLFYLFKDLIRELGGEQALVGKSHTFKDIFFTAPNFRSMIETPNVSIEQKDHDFVIGVSVNAQFSTRNVETHVLEIPTVAIECKTYLDKTMLESSSRSAEELKARNPNSLYIVIMEWLKLSDYVNLRKFKVDQIYVLRKQKNTDRKYRLHDDYVKKPLDTEVVYHLFSLVRKHLTTDWKSGIQDGLARGWLL